MARAKHQFLKTGSRIFFAQDLDSQITLMRFAKFDFLRRPFGAPVGRASDATPAALGVIRPSEVIGARSKRRE